MYYGVEEDFNNLAGNPPEPTNWNVVAQQAGTTAQNIMQQYMDLQAAKHGLPTTQQPTTDAKVPAPQPKKTGTLTPWLIGAAGLALVGGYYLFARKKASNPGSTGWKTIGD